MPVLAAAAGLFACAGLPKTKSLPPGVAARARQAPSYSGRLKVSLKTRSLRGRSRVLLAFQRPTGLRVEVPGPAGLHIVAVARGNRLVAVFPRHRAVFIGEADPASMEALLGIPLEPTEVMDLLVGISPRRLRSYRAGWGATLPLRIKAVLADGGRLDVKVEEAELGVALPSRAFDDPPHPGYRSLNREEARRLWSGR